MPEAVRTARLAAVLSLALVATARAQGVDQPVVIDYADEIRRIADADSLTYYLEGHVRAHRGAIQMRGQRAVIYRASGIADFQRDVHFWDRVNEIYADHVIYYEASNTALATGRVQLIDRQSGSQLLADTVHYDRDENLVIARPRPHGVIVSADTSGQESPFDVYADEMRMVTDSTGSRVDASRRVLIEREDLTAVGDSLHYDDRTGRVELRIEPRVETAETYLTADRIDVLLEQNSVRTLIALERARAVDKTDSIPGTVAGAFGNVSQTSFLEGDSLNVDFAGQGIDWLVAQGHARSLHYERESPPGEVETWSVNYLLGERLRLDFRGDTLGRVVATGGSRGVYRTEQVRIGGPERRPSEPIPLPALSSLAGLPARRPWPSRPPATRRGGRG